MAHKVIVPQKKIISRSFLNSGTLIVNNAVGIFLLKPKGGGVLGLFYCIILSAALLHLYSNLPHLNDRVTFVITSAMFAESSPWPLVCVVSPTILCLQ